MSVLRDIANAADYGDKLACVQQAESGLSGIGRVPTLTENLEAKKTQLESNLARVNKALDALRANPNFEEMINLLSNV